MADTATLLAAALAVAVLSTAVAAQQPPAPANTRDVLLGGWNEVGQKFVALAEEFPEDKYDYRPTADVRTFGDVARHVAFWNGWVAKTARGEKADGSPNELPKAQFATKAAVVAALKSSLAEAAAALRQHADAPEPRQTSLWASFIAHTSEHYGQLVVYYRLNGLVPPASRGQ
jgi:hypothetical protein